LIFGPPFADSCAGAAGFAPMLPKKVQNLQIMTSKGGIEELSTQLSSGLRLRP
jgi:hypothetical protein